MRSGVERIIKTFFKTTKHKGKKNVVLCKKSGFVKTKYKIKGRGNVIQTNDSILYRCRFYISGSHNKIIINEGCLLKYVEFHIEDDNNTIIIGKRCSFLGKTQIACIEGTTITIGDGLLSSSDVRFRTSDSHSITDLNGARINAPSDIVVGNNVWLCQKATLLKGSKIPDHCVVAFGSIVTKKFDEPHCIIGGIPSKIIKEGIDWNASR